MAVGDVVSGISGVGAVLNFQPAAGVECMITFVFATDISNAFQLDQGVLRSVDCFINQPGPGGLPDTNTGPLKFFVNNTSFLRIGIYPGQRTCFTGIQIQ